MNINKPVAGADHVERLGARHRLFDVRRSLLLEQTRALGTQAQSADRERRPTCEERYAAERHDPGAGSESFRDLEIDAARKAHDPVCECSRSGMQEKRGKARAAAFRLLQHECHAEQRESVQRVILLARVEDPQRHSERWNIGKRMRPDCACHDEHAAQKRRKENPKARPHRNRLSLM